MTTILVSIDRLTSLNPELVIIKRARKCAPNCRKWRGSATNRYQSQNPNQPSTSADVNAVEVAPIENNSQHPMLPSDQSNQSTEQIRDNATSSAEHSHLY
ncbi:hypothetical protein SSS_06418 [Sarcoptes scabiei]|uniref:Uncharacterized protein n=1 Tax=Sarcoptes scabiei TaxID=52283 RepID=A0A834RFH5_SARSC|nr:hypothetical protein SSS_06418 [Sarcoptes scabiei]